MSDRQAFLATIRQQPDDDAPRLIFADWLEEQGEPERAEYIRVQCTLATLPPGDPREADLRQRESELYETHFDMLAGELPEWCRSCTFRRGFLHSIEVSAVDLVAHAIDLCRVAFPTKITIIDAASHVPAVMALPQLAEVRELEFNDRPWIDPETAMLLREGETNNMTAADAVAIAESPHVTNLRGLRIAPYHDIGMEGCIALFQSKRLANLEALELPGQHVGDEGADALRRAKHLRQLRVLDLSMGRMTPTAATSLANAKHLKSVRTLNLAFNDFVAVGAERLAQAATFKNLHVLSLAANEIGDDGLTALAHSPHLTNVRELNLSANAFLFGNAPKIGPRGIKALVEGTTFAKLQTLILRYNNIRPTGMRTLAKATNLPALREIDLLSCAIGAGVTALAKGPLLAQLTRLSLAYCALTDELVADLAASKKARLLQHLELDGNALSCVAAEVLAASPNFPALEQLSLYNNHVRAQGANALARSSHFPALRNVSLGSNQITPRTVQSIARKRGNVFSF